MALPWLIGGLLVAAGTALVKKLNEDGDSSSSSSSNDTERESHRREVAERERAENERNKKLNTARETFAIRGESIGSDIAQSLQGWIKVEFEQSPAFSVKLDSNSSSSVGRFVVLNAISTSLNEKSINALIPSNTPQFEVTRKNLKSYSETYSIKLEKGAKLVEMEREIELIEFELKQMSLLKEEISTLQGNLSPQT